MYRIINGCDVTGYLFDNALSSNSLFYECYDIKWLSVILLNFEWSLVLLIGDYCSLIMFQGLIEPKIKLPFKLFVNSIYFKSFHVENGVKIKHLNIDY